MLIRTLALAGALTCGAGSAQILKLPPGLQNLNDKAVEVVEVSMDAEMLQFAERFLSDRDPEQRKARGLLRSLKSVHVRVFEFDREGQYAAADVEALRSQLKGPGWSRMVEVRSRRDNETVNVFARTENGQLAGMVVVAAEPRELTIVEVDGPIRVEDLAQLGGRFGLPRFKLGGMQPERDR